MAVEGHESLAATRAVHDFADVEVVPRVGPDAVGSEEAASGQSAGYKAHLRGALESGDISEEELWEWLVHYAHYAGWPSSANVWGDLRELIAERRAAGE